MGKQHAKCGPEFWEHWEIPTEDLDELARMFGAEVFPHIARHMRAVLGSGLQWEHRQMPTALKRKLDPHHQTAMNAALFFIIGDYIVTRYQPTHPEYKAPLLPEWVPKFLIAPYCWTRDLNLAAQKKFREDLPKQYKAMVTIDD